MLHNETHRIVKLFNLRQFRHRYPNPAGLDRYQWGRVQSRNWLDKLQAETLLSHPSHLEDRQFV